MQRPWIALTVVLIVGFSVLAWIGTRLYQEMPAIPERVVSSDGRQVSRPGEIMHGQHIRQTIGGMEVGSVWGHAARDRIAQQQRDAASGSQMSCDLEIPDQTLPQTAIPEFPYLSLSTPRGKGAAAETGNP